MMRSTWRLLAVLIPAVPMVLLFAAWIFLSLPMGRKWMAGEASRLVNGQIQGRVALDSISLGFDGIALDGIEVFDPEGRKVLASDHVRVRAIPTFGLLRGRVGVDSLSIDRPAVWWITPEGGGEAGLVRAFAPRVLTQAEPGEKLRFEVRLDDVRIEGGAVWIQEQGPDELTTLAALESFSLEARGIVHDQGANLKGTVTAEAMAPLRVPLRVEWDGSAEGEYASFDLRNLVVQVGESSVRLSGNGDLESHAATITRLEATISPNESTLVAPTWQLAQPLEVGGVATFREGNLESSLEIHQGPAREQGLFVQMGLQPLAGSWSLKVKGRAVDPASLDRRAPRGSLDFTLDGMGSSWSEGSAALAVERFEVGGERAGPIRAMAVMDQRRLEIRELDARLPGGRVKARGSQDLDPVLGGDLHFDLELTDLQRLGRWLGTTLGDPTLVPPLEGALLAQGRVSGPPAGRRIAAKVSSKRFRYGEVAAKGVSGSLSIDGFPGAPTGNADLTTESLQLGTTRFDAVRADLELQRGRLRGALEGRGLVGSLHTEIDAATNRDLSELKLEQLLVSWPRASWRLQKPARVALGAQNEIEGLALVSGDGGLLELSGSQGPGEAFRLDLKARGFDLATLPAELAPAELGLAGRLDIDAALSGTTHLPRGRVQVALQGGGLSGEALLDSTLDLQFRGRSLETLLTARSSTGSLDATASLPWPWSDRKPLKVEATLTRLDLREISRLLALPKPFTGWVGGEIQVGGTASSPVGTVALQGEGLGGGGLAVQEATASLSVDANEKTVRILTSVQRGEARAEADLALGANVATFLADASTWRRVGLVGNATVEGVDLADWLPAEWTGDPLKGVRGKAAATVALKGSLSAPVGDVRLQIQDGFSGGVGPLDLDLGLALAEKDLRVSLVSRLLGKRFVQGQARLGAPIQKVLEGGWESAPLDGEFLTEELDLAAVAWALGHRDPLGGALDLTLRLDGSPRAPRLAVHGRAGQVLVGSLPFGDLSLGATYGNRNLVAEIGALDSQGGEARIGARWKVDLGSRALPESLGTLASAPLDLTLTARRFDLEFLEGLSRDLRQAGGKLSGELTVSGQLPLPALDGRLQLEEGRLSYTGHGDLRDISALLEFSQNEWQLRHLEAHEAGVFRMSGSARRMSPLTPFHVSMEMETRRFAVMASDLNRAWLDAKAQLTGTLDERGFKGSLDITRATVTLPDTPKKNIQSLEPHPDFVFVGTEGGRRLPRQKEKKARSSDGMELSLAIASSQPIHLTGTDLSMEANVDLEAAMVGGSLALAGDITVPRGFVRVMNRRFDLSRGRVSFLGPGSDPGDPRLDVQALYESPYATVTVTVSGTVSKPAIHLRSNPAMSEAEIAMLLATGRAQLKAGSGGVSEASGAASALGTVLSSQLKKGVAARLPVDVISFEAGEEGLEGSRLEAGTYVGEKMYFGYARRFEGQSQARKNENEVRFEYQLAPRWSLEVTYGDAYVGGADIFWTRDF